MIYKTHRIAKASVDKEDNDIKEDMIPSNQWEDVISRISFRLEHIMYWEEYKGNGGNDVDYFAIPNNELCFIETDGGCKYVIIESYNSFGKVMEEFDEMLSTKG